VHLLTVIYPIATQYTHNILTLHVSVGLCEQTMYGIINWTNPSFIILARYSDALVIALHLYVSAMIDWHCRRRNNAINLLIR